jgi:hypothetical protein
MEWLMEENKVKKKEEIIMPMQKDNIRKKYLALYRIGIALNSEFMGTLLTRFILSCWQEQAIPVIDCRFISTVKKGALVTGCLAELKTKKKKGEYKIQFLLDASIENASKEVYTAISHIVILCKQFILHLNTHKQPAGP